MIECITHPFWLLLFSVPAFQLREQISSSASAANEETTRLRLRLSELEEQHKAEVAALTGQQQAESAAAEKEKSARREAEASLTGLKTRVVELENQVSNSPHSDFLYRVFIFGLLFNFLLLPITVVL
jgi:DNA repair exonuclease SbcCD ATPase subunit